MDLSDERIKHISTEELKKMLRQKKDVLLLDVNPRDRYEKHHIKDCVFVDYELAARWVREQKIPKDKTIVVYCENTMCTASPIVAKKLVTLGYANVFEYQDGIQGWIAGGGEWEGNDKK